MSELIGARVRRIEDQKLLRGTARFVDDIVSPGVLSAAFVRSPHPHALIRGIDPSAARAVPGVVAVLTLDDLAPVLKQRRMMRVSNSGTRLDQSWPFALADGEVSFVGEPVAIVLAADRYVAEDAAALVAVDYDVLPAATDCRTAARAPGVRRELSSNQVIAYKVGFGDIEAAFAKAGHVVHEDLWMHRGAGHSHGRRAGFWPKFPTARSTSGLRRRRPTICATRSPTMSLSTKAACAWRRRTSAAASDRNSASIPRM